MIRSDHEACKPNSIARVSGGLRYGLVQACHNRLPRRKPEINVDIEQNRGYGFGTTFLENVMFDRCEQAMNHALQFAYNAHLGKFRKNGRVPYIIHPLEVMKQLSRWGITDTDIQQAALLHDVVEDTDYTYQNIEDEFGFVVAEIVKQLTFVYEGDGTDKKEKKQEYIASFQTKSVPALLIKAADRLCNTIDFMPDRYAKKYLHMGKPVFDAIIDRKKEIDKFVFCAIMYDYNGLRHRLAETLPS